MVFRQFSLGKTEILGLEWGIIFLATWFKILG